MRLLYLQPSSSFGGAERQAAQLMALLPRHGIEVVPMVGPGREMSAFLEDAGVTEYLFQRQFPDDTKAPRGALKKLLLGTDYMVSFARLVRTVARVAVEYRCDLLFASRPFAWILASIAGSWIGRPVVWRVGTQIDHVAQAMILRRFARILGPRIAIYTSHSVCAGIGPIVPCPALVVHNGVDVERFSLRRALPSLRDDLGIPMGAPVVALVARLAPEKGTDLLVKSCRRLRDRVPSLKVLVAGDSGWRAQFERSYEEAGLRSTVQLLGFVRNVERVYAAADVVVSTSSEEGCPNAVLEAMAMERAVVATNVGGTRELIQHGRDGVLVSAGDVEGLADSVITLLRSTPRRRALGSAARTTVLRRFALDRQVARVAQIVRWAGGGGG